MQSVFSNIASPETLLTYFTDGGGRGRGPRDFSEMLAKKDFLGSVKDVGNFWGHKERDRYFLGYCTFPQLKSTITKAQFTVGVECFWVC